MNPYDPKEELYVPNTPFDCIIHDALHTVLDRMLAAGSNIEAHADVLDPDEEDQPNPAATLLRAQLGVQGGEDEIHMLNDLTKILSALLIIRQSRNIILDNTSILEEEPVEQ
jgi:hypothetical protein